MKFFNKILKFSFNIIIIFLILLVIIVAYNFIQLNVLNRLYPNFFGYTFFETTTGSMVPTIEISDLIIVKITRDVEENDIISFMENGEIITHRIKEEKNDVFITKGDANTGEDRPIDKNIVIGKVVKILPKFGIWVKVFTDVKVTASILTTLALFGFAFASDKKQKEPEEETSFNRFMKNRREKRNGKNKEKKKSKNKIP